MSAVLAEQSTDAFLALAASESNSMYRLHISRSLQHGYMYDTTISVQALQQMRV